MELVNLHNKQCEHVFDFIPTSEIPSLRLVSKLWKFSVDHHCVLHDRCEEIVNKIYPLHNPFAPTDTLISDLEITKAFFFQLGNLWRMEQAIQKSKAAPLVFNIIEHPEKYISFRKSMWGDFKGELFGNLHECACVQTEEFHRFKNPRRVTVENRIIADTLSRFKKEEEIRYLSLGAGGCLQDFMSLGRLLREGYRNIQAVLIDPQFAHGYDHLKRELLLLSAAAQELGGNLSISFLPSIQTLNSSDVDALASLPSSFDIIAAIDFDDIDSALDDVFFAQTLLSEQGIYYLSFGQHDLTFNPHTCTEIIYKEMETMTTCALALEEEAELCGKKDLSCAFLTSNLKTWQWFMILPSIAKAWSVERIMLMMPSVENSSEKTLSQFLSLLAKKPIDVTFAKNPSDFIRTTIRFDFVSLFACIGTKFFVERDFRRSLHYYPESSFFFMYSIWSNDNETAQTASGFVRPSGEIRLIKGIFNDETSTEMSVASLVKLRAIYDAGFGNFLEVRGTGPGMTWEEGLPMTWAPGNEWILPSFPRGAFEYKVVLRSGDRLQWEKGKNHNSTSDSLPIYPVF